MSKIIAHTSVRRAPTYDVLDYRTRITVLFAVNPEGDIVGYRIRCWSDVDHGNRSVGTYLAADGKYLCFCILLLKVHWETFASKLCSTTDVRNDYPLIDIRFHSDSKGSFHSNGITLITRARYFTWLASYRFDRASRSFDFTPKFS